MAAFPICADCYTTPTHRTHPLKMHFFPRALGAAAVADAEANILVEPQEQ